VRPAAELDTRKRAKTSRSRLATSCASVIGGTQAASIPNHANGGVPLFVRAAEPGRTHTD
jgi:hypothetical protein